MPIGVAVIIIITINQHGSSTSCVTGQKHQTAHTHCQSHCSQGMHQTLGGANYSHYSQVIRGLLVSIGVAVIIIITISQHQLCYRAEAPNSTNTLSMSLQSRYALDASWCQLVLHDSLSPSTRTIVILVVLQVRSTKQHIHTVKVNVFKVCIRGWLVQVGKRHKHASNS